MSVSEETPCCCRECKVYQSGNIWGTGGLTETSTTLSELCLIVFGTFDACGNEFPPFSTSELKDWIRTGGILCVKTEWPTTCADPGGASSFLAAVGSSMSVGSSPIACQGTEGGYIGSVAQFPVTAGMASTMNSGGFSAPIIGGNAIVTAPFCSVAGRPGGPVLSGEQIGSGAVFIIGDSNLNVPATLINNAVSIQARRGNYF